jgi:hypothetical protein
MDLMSRLAKIKLYLTLTTNVWLLASFAIQLHNECTAEKRTVVENYRICALLPIGKLYNAVYMTEKTEHQGMSVSKSITDESAEILIWVTI